MKLLHIQVSPALLNSSSRKISNYLVEKIKKEKPGIIETILDLDSNPIPHLNGLTISAFFTHPEKRTPEQHAAIKLSDQLVDQLLDTDVVVISTPMWNLGLPSVLKAWFDHITRAGRTFAFTGEGKVGLVHGKKVYVVLSSGGLFSAGPTMNDDQCSPYFKSALSYIGINDVEIIRVEGNNMPSVSGAAIPTAITKIDELVIA